LKGLINKKSEPFKDITDDTASLMCAIEDFFPETNVPFMWHRRSTELELLQRHITYEMVLNYYNEMLLSKESRRMAIFRTFPQSQHSLAKSLHLENNALIMDNDKRIDNILVHQNHFVMNSAI